MFSTWLSLTATLPYGGEVAGSRRGFRSGSTDLTSSEQPALSLGRLTPENALVTGTSEGGSGRLACPCNPGAAGCTRSANLPAHTKQDRAEAPSEGDEARPRLWMISGTSPGDHKAIADEA